MVVSCVVAHEIAGFTAWLKNKEARQATLVYYRANLQPACTLSFPGLRIAGIDSPPAAPAARGAPSIILKHIVRLSPGTVSFAAS
jgi:hypothetical protein